MDEYKQMFKVSLRGAIHKTPLLLIGYAAKLFRDEYRGEIYHIENNEDLKEIMSYVMYNDYNNLIVLDDISLIQDKSLLLKFIEDAQFQLIMLASQDKFDRTFLSRIKLILKYPYDTKTEYIQNNINDILGRIEQNKDLKNDKFLAENSPELYYYFLRTSSYVSNTKIIRLLS